MTTSRLVALLSAVLLTGCPTTSGPQGETGPQGPAGATGAKGDTGAPGAQGVKGDTGDVGPAGAAGPKGDKGDPGNTGPAGATGAMGSTGAAGAQGPQGPQGVQGPAGTVLVLDGGVVTGPAGSSVIVTTITAGGSVCPTGGVRVTQLSDGGITNVCNGAAGAQGLQGVAGTPGAQGIQGVPGVQGPAGPALATTVLAVSSPQCVGGGLLITLPDGGAVPVCNGAPGANGTNGAPGTPGSPGSQGPQGPAGPQGPSGGVLYVDGGVYVPSTRFEFAGYTAATYTADLGGYAGANAKCDAEFPGSYFCTYPEYDQANPTFGPGDAGAWVDFARTAVGARQDTGCTTVDGPWTYGSTGASGRVLTPRGNYYSTFMPCNTTRPLPCCRNPSAAFVFRGYTTATYTADLGGYAGANAKCSAQFPGSWFCTYPEYDLSNPAIAPGAAGAWVDFARTSTGARQDTGCTTVEGPWTYGGTGASGRVLTPKGNYYSTFMPCNSARPIACCGSR